MLKVATKMQNPKTQKASKLLQILTRLLEISNFWFRKLC